MNLDESSTAQCIHNVSLFIGSRSNTPFRAATFLLFLPHPTPSVRTPSWISSGVNNTDLVARTCGVFWYKSIYPLSSVLTKPKTGHGVETNPQKASQADPTPYISP